MGLLEKALYALAGVDPDEEQDWLNYTFSFITNANWQAYAGETTMSHFTQMAGPHHP